MERVSEERRARQRRAGLLATLLCGAGESCLELGATVGDHVRTSRVRGSRNPYRMSTTRFAKMMITESITVIPIVTE